MHSSGFPELSCTVDMPLLLQASTQSVQLSTQQVPCSLVTAHSLSMMWKWLARLTLSTVCAWPYSCQTSHPCPPVGCMSSHCCCCAAQAGRCVLPWWLRLRLAAQISAAIAYLHNLPSSAGGPLIHRDIKPANMFLDGRLNAKVGGGQHGRGG